MYRTFITLLLFINGMTVFGQKKKTTDAFYLWTKEWKVTRINDEAAYFGRLSQQNDSSWEWDVYSYMGPRISSQHFKDPDLKIAHGMHTYYHLSGYIDSSGPIVNNHKQGNWNYYNDTGKNIFIKTFDQGNLIAVKDILKEPDSAKEKNDLKDGEIESGFPGGIHAWQKYLLKNLVYPDRALNGKIKGQVVTSFIIDANGIIENADIFKSVEYSLDEETLALIRRSPKWEPATQAGHHVKSYKRQPLIYQF